MAGCFLHCCLPGAGGIRGGTQTLLDHTKRRVSALLNPRIVAGLSQRLLGYQKAPARKATGENALALIEIGGWPYIGKPKFIGKARGPSWLLAWKELRCLAALWLQQHRRRPGCVCHRDPSWGPAVLGPPQGHSQPLAWDPVQLQKAELEAKPHFAGIEEPSTARGRLAAALAQPPPQSPGFPGAAHAVWESSPCSHRAAQPSALRSPPALLQRARKTHTTKAERFLPHPPSASGTANLPGTASSRSLSHGHVLGARLGRVPASPEQPRIPTPQGCPPGELLGWLGQELVLVSTLL